MLEKKRIHGFSLQKQILNETGSCSQLCISSPGLAPQLTILSGHTALGSPSRLHRLQDPGLNLPLLWACLADHGNKNGRAFEPFGELVSTPGHGIIHAKIADFFNV